MTLLFPEPGPKVLLVASDRELIGLLLDIQRRAGISAFVVHDELEALRFVLAERPAAVILDLPAEDRDRLEFMRVLRRRGRVLTLTSSEVQEEELAPYELVRKPLSPRQLVDRLERLLSEPALASGASRWTTKDLARGRIAVATGGCDVVVSFRTRPGELLSVHQSIEAEIAEFALECAKGLANGGKLVTHLEVVADLYTVEVARGPRLAIDLTVLGLANGVDGASFAILVEGLAKRRVAARALIPRPRVRVIATRLAPAMHREEEVDDEEDSPPAARKDTSSGPRSRGLRRAVSTLAASMLAAVLVALLLPQQAGERQAKVSGAMATAAPATIASGRPVAPDDVVGVRNIQEPRAELIAPAPQVRPAPPTLAMAPTPAALLPDPTDRVLQFYQWLQQGDFDAITLILSPRMRAEVPWDPGLLRQRLPAGQMTVLKAELVPTVLTATQATVVVEVLEQVPPPLTTTRKYVGTWDLVRGPSGWLLDHPDIQIE